MKVAAILLIPLTIQALRFSQYLEFFREEMVKCSDYLDLEYEEGAGFRTVAKRDIPPGTAPLISVPSSFVISACKGDYE